MQTGENNISCNFDNTVITASDGNYAWGVFLLVASMRLNGMAEPVIVFAKKYTERQKRAILQFENVELFERDDFPMGMNCFKPEAMLAAKTAYTTWVDCDGFFTGNCSAELIPLNSGEIHTRSRGAAELATMRCSETGADGVARISPEILEVWRKDVGERAEPAFDSLVVTNFLSVHRDDFYILERWKTQMQKVLPNLDLGALDPGSVAYNMMDESVFNSLLYYMEKRPAVAKSYRLASGAGRYAHFPFLPKPWKAWTKYNLKFFDRYVSLVEKIAEKGLEFPDEIPESLKRKNKRSAEFFAAVAPAKKMWSQLTKKIKRAFHQILCRTK